MNMFRNGQVPPVARAAAEVTMAMAEVWEELLGDMAGCDHTTSCDCFLDWEWVGDQSVMAKRRGAQVVLCFADGGTLTGFLVTGAAYHSEWELNCPQLMGAVDDALTAVTRRVYGVPRVYGEGVLS